VTDISEIQMTSTAIRRDRWESMEINESSDDFEGKKGVLTDLKSPLEMGQCNVPGVDATPRTRYAGCIHGSGRAEMILQRLEGLEAGTAMRRERERGHREKGVRTANR
jgi:hypothetical protein